MAFFIPLGGNFIYLESGIASLLLVSVPIQTLEVIFSGDILMLIPPLRIHPSQRPCGSQWICCFGANVALFLSRCLSLAMRTKHFICECPVSISADDLGVFNEQWWQMELNGTRKVEEQH